MFSVRSSRSKNDIDALVDIHREFFHESLYRRFTWDEKRARESILHMMCDSDFETVIAITDEGQIAGFFTFAFERPWMVEEVALCVNFYVLPEFRRGKCSQMMLDFGTEICQNRGAGLSWMSSTAGFSDNGCNERAFRMLLKRNGFREVGTFLIREFGHEQGQKGI